LTTPADNMAAKGADAEMKTEVLDWIEAVIKSPVPRDQPFEKVLKDGQILCQMINVLLPGSVKRVAKKGSNFQLMENLAAYQKACKKYGVCDEEIFQTPDLFEARNVKQVVLHLFALGRTAQVKGFDGPTLGPKTSEENKRNFTEEQNRASRDAHIGLQAGQNKGASQAGINMGKGRNICD
jgi:hypothetical protein